MTMLEYASPPIWLNAHIRDPRIIVGNYTYFDRHISLAVFTPDDRIEIGKFCSLGKCHMDKTLTLRYDKVGDILYIDTCLPYADQESEEIGDEVIARLNPTSGEIENLEILFFSRRSQEMAVTLPINAELKLVG